MKRASQHNFWDTDTGLVLKVLVLSAGLSVAIKYIGPSLAIPATPTNALIAVFLPTLLMSLALAWRSWQQR